MTAWFARAYSNRMLICETATGVILSATAAACELLAQRELVGASLEAVLPAGTFPARLRELAQLEADRSCTVEWTFRVADRDVVADTELARIGDRTAIAITPRAFDDASARLAFLLRTTSAITYSCGALDGGHARVTFMSENVAQVLGYSAREFNDDPGLWGRCLHPDDRARVVATVPRIHQGEELALEYRFRHRDGTWRWMRDDAKAVTWPDGSFKEIVGSWVDITREREIDAALQRSEASFRAVIDSLPQAVFVRSGEQIVYANAACAELLKVGSVADLIGLRPLDFSPAYNHAAVRQRMSKANQTGRSTAHESEWRCFDGSVVPVEVEALAIEYRGESSMLVIARSLTERRAMITRTAAANRMLAHATLAAGVAHEINGPLAYLITNLSILADEIPYLQASEPGVRRRTRADIERLLKDTQEGASRVREVVRDLRHLSRPADDAAVSSDIGAVIASCVKMGWQEAEGRARLVTDIRDVVPVRGNAARLAQVFSNLIANAIHAIAPNASTESEIRLHARRHDSNHVIVEVSDTGVGMPPDVVAQVFEPFFTTKPTGVGTGLGLAICQSIVTALGGTITVSSEVGRGTRFAVLLPIAPESASAMPPEPTVDAGRGRILVVDDDASFARSVQLLLDDHEVVTAASATHALEHLHEKEAFDLVLCDLSMPAMDGMEFHSRVTEIAPAIAARIVFVTGGARSEAGEAFLGKNVTLHKPFDPVALTTLVSRAVASRSATS